MKLLVLQLLVTAALMLHPVTSSPVGPFADVTILRVRPAHTQHINTHTTVKGHRPPLELNLRKGEYMCGDKVCKLQPGQEPTGCNGICQYPV